MTLARWDPFPNITTLQDRINRLFDDSFPGVRGQLDDDISRGTWNPAVDIYETEEAVVIMAELPGVNKEDVSIEVKGNILSIGGERRGDTTITEENYYRRERYFGAFRRAFNLQDPVNPDNVKARFKEGVLTIEILKAVEGKPKRITVAIE